MDNEELDLAHWRLGLFFGALGLNSIILGLCIFSGNTQQLEGAMLFLVWAMTVGISSTWIAIVHLLYCRAKSVKKWYLLYYVLPGILLLLVVKYVDLPIPGKRDTSNPVENLNNVGK
jgi:hypothetical protein